MKARVLAELAASNTVIPLMTCLALVIFLSFFIGMLLWTRRKESHLLYKNMSQMPFEENP